MASLNITPATTQDRNRLLAALEADYQATVFVDGVEVPNPETIADYRLRILGEVLAEFVANHEGSVSIQQINGNKISLSITNST